ncbi:hypothetical protein KIW84_010914 [Lathyrus oleraceus]|uniref:PRONE domain-containing protein n=1 Tax=Pisum sativum TaxID=3888 RepID=A0A9D5BAD3_PEA|nr:hypothetical protein KIW84_010914 [Pisum sativum]
MQNNTASCIRPADQYTEQDPTIMLQTCTTTKLIDKNNWPPYPPALSNSRVQTIARPSSVPLSATVSGPSGSLSPIGCTPLLQTVVTTGVRRLVIIEVESRRVEFYSASNRFSSGCLFGHLNISSEHVALKIANHVEAAFCVWRQRAHQNVP